MAFYKALGSAYINSRLVTRDQIIWRDVDPGSSFQALSSAESSRAVGDVLSANDMLYRALADRARVRNVLNYGAVGDGVADDTVAIQAALNDAFASNGNGFVYIPYGLYKVTDTLTFTLSSHRYRNWGIISDGGVLLSAIPNTAKNVLYVIVQTASGAQCRNFMLVGLTIEGQSGASPVEQDGVSLLSDQSGQALYSFFIERCSFEALGRHGLQITGNVFEGYINDCKFRGCGDNGINFANGSSGIVSSIHINNCNIAQNFGEGVDAGATINDIYYSHCDFIGNGSYGISNVNGIPLITGCHFENNHAQAGSFVDGQGAIACNNFITAIGCVAFSSGASSKQANLLRTSVVNNAKLIGCWAASSGGASACTLVFLTSNGTAGRSVFLDNCIGTITSQTPVSSVVVDGHPRPITVISPRTLAIQESGAVINNTGASGSTAYTLPTSANTRPGDEYTFVVLAAQNMVVTANTGVTIRIAGSTSTSGGTATNGTVGGVLKIRAHTTTLWVAEFSTGTWTLA